MTSRVFYNPQSAKVSVVPMQGKKKKTFHKQDEDQEELHREGEEDLQAYVITNEPVSERQLLAPSLPFASGGFVF